MKRRLLNGNLIIYANVIVILLMLLARHALSMNIHPVLILLVAILPALFATKSQILAIVISFLTLGVGFQYKYALLMYLIIGIFRFYNKLMLSKLVIPIALMMVWELMHSITGTIYLSEYFRQFAELLFLVFVASIKWDEVNYEVIARTLALSVVGVSVVIIIVHLHNGLGNILDLFEQSSAEAARFGQNTTKEGTRFGLNFNANSFGFICNMAISSLLILMYRKQGKFIDIILLGICLFFGLATLSRTFVVVLLFQLMLFVFASAGNVREKIKTFVRIFLLVSVLLLVIMEFAPFIFENFITRNETDDITNGRAFLMEFYNIHIFSSFKYLFWGVGLQGYGAKMMDLYGANILVCHNGIQELCVIWGVFGIVLFGYFLMSLIKESGKLSGKRILIAYVPLLVMLLDSMAGQLVSSGPAMLSMSLIYVTLCLKWK